MICVVKNHLFRRTLAMANFEIIKSARGFKLLHDNFLFIKNGKSGTDKKYQNYTCNTKLCSVTGKESDGIFEIIKKADGVLPIHEHPDSLQEVEKLKTFEVIKEEVMANPGPVKEIVTKILSR
jgi:hypothetical protein